MDFTDFIVWVKGGQAIEFRHQAKTVDELWGVRDEFLTDLYGFQSICRSEIRAIHLDPRPYYPKFYEKYGRFPWGYNRELWQFINRFSEEEKERIREDYYKKERPSNG